MHIETCCDPPRLELKQKMDQCAMDLLARSLWKEVFLKILRTLPSSQRFSTSLITSSPSVNAMNRVVYCYYFSEVWSWLTRRVGSLVAGLFAQPNAQVSRNFHTGLGCDCLAEVDVDCYCQRTSSHAQKSKIQGKNATVSDWGHIPIMNLLHKLENIRTVLS